MRRLLFIITGIMLITMLAGCAVQEEAGKMSLFRKKMIVGTDIAFEDITDFYYTEENINYDAYYQRYRFYVEDGKHLFFHETRERKNDYGPCTEEDTVQIGTMELSEDQWSEFTAFVKGGTVTARKDPVDSDGRGPWLYLYWKKDKSKDQRFAFESRETEAKFEEYCQTLAPSADRSNGQATANKIDENSIRKEGKDPMRLKEPRPIKSEKYRFDSFSNMERLENRVKKHLPPMGWNSWNAFGCGNTEELTKKMVECMVNLGLDELGYQYVVLDDGCYCEKRENDRLKNEPMKFPNDFKELSDFVHKHGMKFGMYNDIGTKLCSGLEVGTCGYEEEDAKSYVDWDIDYIKVDNCYYPWDNATFSDESNAKYVFAPKIKGIVIENDQEKISLQTSEDGRLTGEMGKVIDGYAVGIGTFDGTGPERTPIGSQSSELRFFVKPQNPGRYDLLVDCELGEEEGIGSWLQVAVEGEGASKVVFDDFYKFAPIPIEIGTTGATIRLMNHRRQENVLESYAKFLEEYNKLKPDNDLVLSICEWGKTEPHNWGYKVGDCWRILNDITFEVGRDGYNGKCTWESDYTTSVTSQYNKAVIMDEFAGLDKGWNDPDMLAIGMDGLTLDMCRTHMATWCMMNAPLMLGIDLRRMKRGDDLWNIIANKELIALNQDALGVQAKRVCVITPKETILDDADTRYIRDNNRVDILAKPLSDGSVAIAFVNLSGEDYKREIRISLDVIVEKIGKKMINASEFAGACAFQIKDLETGNNIQAVEGDEQNKSWFFINDLRAYCTKVIKVTVLR